MEQDAIRLLYEDAQLLVCVKPAGLDTERELPARLRAQCGGEVYCVHRLDRVVGGVMVYARTRDAAAALSAASAERRLDKRYLAAVQGRPAQESAELRDLLYHDARKNKSYVVRRPRRGVREAVLRYRVLDAAETGEGALSLLAIRLETGRSHQIRVQFGSRGLPLAYDARYGSSLRGGEPALWSAALAFAHPSTGQALRFAARPPETWPWTLFEKTLCGIEGGEALADL